MTARRPFANPFYSKKGRGKSGSVNPPCSLRFPHLKSQIPAGLLRKDNSIPTDAIEPTQ
ncbi:hypothetical protein CKA32_002692 [Geitlerinema sp. FC II]|nr:hypothetical protein CKA32_002692 [Geitlerinema sp. FC II]